jgi:hypothetical protein
MKLTEYEWNILNELQDQDEPFEVIDASLVERFRDSTPQKLLASLFKLYQFGFISAKQTPIKPLGQAFKEKDLKPKNEMDLLGDLKSEYESYFKSRLAQKKKAPEESQEDQATIPLGIWIDITEKGQAEYDSDEYMQFWPNHPEKDDDEED